MDAWERRMTARPDPEPRLDLIESCWTFKSPTSQRVISYGIYQTDAGLEIRAGYSDDDILRTERVPAIESARVLADGWRAMMRERGFPLSEGRA